MASGQVSMLLLSDLHFGDNLEEVPQIQPANCFPIDIKPRLLKFFVQKLVKKFFSDRCKGHNSNLIRALPSYIKWLIFHETVPDFDLCLLLGDQATKPTLSSYQLLANYLTKEKVAQGEYILSPGLNISLDKFLAIPGNHDKLLLPNLDFYNESFGGSLQLMPMPKNKVLLVKRELKGMEFLFILVDGNAYSSNDCRVIDLSFRKHLACGWVDEKTVDSLKKDLSDLGQQKTVNGIHFNDFSRVVRILLVHYAVDLREVAGLWQKVVVDLFLPHHCKGLEVLIAGLKEQVDVVLHGHLHKPKIYTYESVPVISATTTSHVDGPNGFYTLTFNGMEMSADYHVWDNNNHFNPDSKNSAKITLYNRFRSSRSVSTGAS